MLFTSDGCSTEDHRRHRLIFLQLRRCSRYHRVVHYSALHHEKEDDRRALTPKRKLIHFSRGRETRSGAVKLCSFKCCYYHYYDHVSCAFSYTHDDQIFSGRHIYCSVWDTGSLCKFDDRWPALLELCTRGASPSTGSFLKALFTIIKIKSPAELKTRLKSQMQEVR